MNAVLGQAVLDQNNLTGPIAPELGNLSDLGALSLTSNDLSGSVPPELGALPQLALLELAHNAGLAGPLPQSLTTDICPPFRPRFGGQISARRTGPTEGALAVP